MYWSIAWRTGARFLLALALLLVVNFVLPRLLPGDPLITLYGEEAVRALSPEASEALERKLQLDRPLPVQFASYLAGIARFDLGFSYHQGQPVLDIVLAFAPWTMLLACVSLTVSTLAGGVLGLASAWRRGNAGDRGSRLLLMLLNSVPPFVLAMLLLRALAIDARLFPLSGATSILVPDGCCARVRDIAWHAVLPCLALIFHETPNLFLLVRAAALRWAQKPFVTVCRGKGLSEQSVCYGHVGLCVFPVVLSRTGQSVAALLGGAMFVEIVFAYPGLGLLVAESLEQHDYPLVQGVLLVIGTCTLLVNLLADLLAVSLQRRIRL